MVADVPVGVLLCGGLDSSSILASLNYQKYKHIETFNIGFNEKKHNESHLAKLLAKQYNYQFNTLTLDDKTLFDKLLQATYYQDEPLMHLNEPHLLAIANLAKPKVIVLLSDEGADDLMGGYVRYKALKNKSLLQIIATLGTIPYFTKNQRYQKLFRYATLNSDTDLLQYNGCNIYKNDIAKNFGICSEPDNSYRKQIIKEAKLLYPNNLQRQLLYFDQHTYMCSLLDRNDRSTMGASIECREPFLDQRLIAGLGSLENKWLFTGKKRKFIQQSAAKTRLPQQILNFRKVGLSTPWESYLTHNPYFKSEIKDFKNSKIFKMPYFENINATKLVSELQKGNNNVTPYIMPLFMLHIWLKHYVWKF
jgi:asparagine synthase (glutamine-hydrolysing)